MKTNKLSPIKVAFLLSIILPAFFLTSYLLLVKVVVDFVNTYTVDVGDIGVFFTSYLIMCFLVTKLNKWEKATNE
jgi:hypothetical protein